MHTFFESRPGTQSKLIHDGVVRQGQCNATIVGNPACVWLIPDHRTAVSGIGRQEMSARWNDSTGGDYQSRGDAP